MKKKNLILRLVSLCMVFAMILNTGVAVQAKDTEVEEKLEMMQNMACLDEDEYLDRVSAMYEKMSVDEINELIDLLVEEAEEDEEVPCHTFALDAAMDGEKPPIDPIKYWQSAWLAAAQIAKKHGFKCAGTLVEYSVKDKDYKESKGKGGLFRDKIIKTDVYKEHLDATRNGEILFGHWVGGYEFAYEDDEDLYYAIHGFEVRTLNNKTYYKFVFRDTFDFDQWRTDPSFSAFVNDWGKLCMHNDILNEIDVMISFTDR